MYLVYTALQLDILNNNNTETFKLPLKFPCAAFWLFGEKNHDRCRCRCMSSHLHDSASIILTIFRNSHNKIDAPSATNFESSSQAQLQWLILRSI